MNMFKGLAWPGLIAGNREKPGQIMLDVLGMKSGWKPGSNALVKKCSMNVFFLSRSLSSFFKSQFQSCS